MRRTGLRHPSMRCTGLRHYTGKMRLSASSVTVAVRRSGAAAAIRHLLARRRVSLLLYHNPEPEVFALHLHYLRSRYNGVALTQVIDAICNGDWRSLPDYPLVITFDDGWRDNLACFELCRHSGFPVTIFACSAIVDTRRHFWWTATPEPEPLKAISTQRRLEVLTATGFSPEREYLDRQALTRQDLESVNDCVEVGAHTRFHPVLTGCTDAEAWEEIHRSRSEIEELTHSPCQHFAYPNGDYTGRELRMVMRAGFRSARTLAVGWNTPSTDPYQLRILGTPDDATVDRLAADLSGAGLLYRPIMRHLRRAASTHSESDGRQLPQGIRS